MPADAYGASPPAPVTDAEPRCWRCNRMIAYLVSRPWRIKCGRCQAVNARD